MEFYSLESLGYPKYSINKQAKVKSAYTENIMRHTIDKDGYHTVAIKHINGRQKQVKIHRLLGLMFIPNPNGLPQVNHKDGNKDNLSLANLEWVTQADNNKHASLTGLNIPNFGSTNGMAKLDELKVTEIKQLFQTTELSNKEIATLYNISRDVIYNIRRGKLWKHV